MLTADKVTELFCMADDFCKFFDKMTAKYTLISRIKESGNIANQAKKERKQTSMN